MASANTIFILLKYKTFIRSFPYMESTRWHVVHRVVGVFLAGGVHTVDDSTRLQNETKSVPFHVYYVHHMDRYQFVHRVLDVIGVRYVHARLSN